VSKKYTRNFTFTPNKIRTQASQDKLWQFLNQSGFLSANRKGSQKPLATRVAQSLYL
jgi:hypothetical protein